MMTDFYVGALFWYSLVGWCTAQLHHYVGFYSHYRGIKCWLVWVTMFIFWPVTLPMFVDVLGSMSKGKK
ncbi:TPA: hypothetical protein ACP4OC_003593 [Enterobacter asburiae]|uniref:hypothetical protein n=1 Tax=Enterobacter sp. EC_64 TaxID=2584092 RepID=UPI001C705294|nr:hypothetical protein [Enterobacter sp. EC_64]MBW9385043.1 hypothetical protein [Enterobacter sp. EC_64]